MTRPPHTPGFAQFFPTAPKVRAEAEVRGDRERPAPYRTNGVDQTRDLAADSESQANGVASSHGRISSDAPQTQAQSRVDGKEPSPGDIPNTVDSTSSHTSTTSSVFSARAAATAASSRYPTASTTPLASKDSPLSFGSTGPSKSEMPSSALNDRAARQPSYTSLAPSHNGFAPDGHPIIERVPARDPTLPAMGTKCTFDPLLERLRNKGVSRSAKPTYKDFGAVCTNIISPAYGRGGVIFCKNSRLMCG